MLYKLGTQQYTEQINSQMHQSDRNRIRDKLLLKQGNSMVDKDDNIYQNQPKKALRQTY
jgi:hypothetical protein